MHIACSITLSVAMVGRWKRQCDNSSGKPRLLPKITSLYLLVSRERQGYSQGSLSWGSARYVGNSIGCNGTETKAGKVESRCRELEQVPPWELRACSQSSGH